MLPLAPLPGFDGFVLVVVVVAAVVVDAMELCKW
jgi:hypothetical protein